MRSAAGWAMAYRQGISTRVSSIEDSRPPLREEGERWDSCAPRTEGFQRPTGSISERPSLCRPDIPESAWEPNLLALRAQHFDQPRQ